MKERKALTLLQISREVLSHLDLEEVLRRLIEAGRTLTGARYAAIGILNEDKDALARFLTVGIDEATHRQIGDLPRGRGVLGELIREPRPLRLTDVSSHPRSYGFPAAHPRMTSFLGVPVVVEGEAYGNLYLAEKQGGAFDEDDEEAVVVLAELAGVALLNARRYGGTRGRAADLEQTVAALEATTEISRALGGTTDLDVVLELISKRGRALVSARTLAIALPERGRLAVAASAGEDKAALNGVTYDPALTVEGAVMQSSSPLRFANRPIGALVALDRVIDGPAFSRDDQRLLEAFAFTAATAIATAQRVASERRGQRLAAAEEERRRWARELHDETLQGLAALRIMLSSARRSESRAELDEAVEMAVEALGREVESLRALISELRPASLDQLGLGAALQALAERVSSDVLTVELDCDLAWERGRETARHGAQLEAGVYRLVQEALTNVSKHANARHARVRVHDHEDVVEVRVADDGRGFDTSSDTGGFGLVGMAERVELLGGELEIVSAPGEGTTVTATLPLTRTETASPAAIRSAG